MHVCKWAGPAVLLPRQRSKLAWGAKDKEHALSQKVNTSTSKANEPFAMRQLAVAK